MFGRKNCCVVAAMALVCISVLWFKARQLRGQRGGARRLGRLNLRHDTKVHTPGREKKKLNRLAEERLSGSWTRHEDRRPRAERRRDAGTQQTIGGGRAARGVRGAIERSGRRWRGGEETGRREQEKRWRSQEMETDKMAKKQPELAQRIETKGGQRGESREQARGNKWQGKKQDNECSQ